jgi:ADP-ribose pyrophosphatase YjhB (NUDIX family)
MCGRGPAIVHRVASPAVIRPVALAAVRRRGDLLVYEGTDPTKDETFYRPLGGGIEFGEPAGSALRREMREELGVEVRNVALLGVLENIFHAFGRPYHEIVFIFSADLADRALYERDHLGVVIGEGSPVSWQPLARFARSKSPLYPTGLLDLLTRPAN